MVIVPCDSAPGDRHRPHPRIPCHPGIRGQV